MAHAGRRAAAALSAGVVGVGAGLRVARSDAGRRARREMLRRRRRMVGHARHLAGRWQGAIYRLYGSPPDPAVIDTVLADRIRSTLGPVEARLDLPRVHVMCQDHVALLHGEVATPVQALEIEAAVAEVPGVVGVRSFLHVGLLPGDSRPSDGGRGRPPSEALRRLRDAAVRAGADEAGSVAAVRAVLAAFVDELPEAERRHLMVHLPDDIRVLLQPDLGHRRRGPAHTRRVGELVIDVVGATDGVPLGRAEHVIESVLGTLRELVPEEGRDVSAVLPTDLRRLWEGAVPG
ncbi:MAG TPA: DUF2267 domain-containing protein [Acidimicrobiales bacterium]|nr:DUF2267 domain-containing protein [Acidimicrobiales bacterium]